MALTPSIKDLIDHIGDLSRRIRSLETRPVKSWDPPAASLLQTTAQPLTNGAQVAIKFDSVVFDTHTMWTATPNSTRLTCQVPGLYTVGGSFSWNNGANTNGFRSVWLAKNGTAIPATYAMQTAGGNVASNDQTVSGLVSLAEGDYVELFAQHNAGTNITLNSNIRTGYTPAVWALLARSTV